jgi:ABC-type nitrate/sulfonate/bicarbonate transport system permease component
VLTAVLVLALLLFLLPEMIARAVDKYKNSVIALRGMRYMTSVSVAALFALWLGDSLYVELIAVSLFFFVNVFYVLIDSSLEVNAAYIDAAFGLKINEGKIYKEVYFKSLLPTLRDRFVSLHLSLWVFVLIYEIFAGENLGAIFKMIVIYSDYSALFLFVIIFSVVIFVLNYLLQTLIDKTIFWNN